MNATVDWNMKSLFGFIKHLMTRKTPVPTPVRQLTSDLDLQSLVDAMLGHQVATRIHGVDSDELPTGYGDFGLCVSNPVPAAGIMGAGRYLNSLVPDLPGIVTFRRLGSTACEEVTSGMIDIYQFCVDGNDYQQIYICHYYGHNSGKAPEGFTLAGRGNE